jgi:hypothetical protein
METCDGCIVYDGIADILFPFGQPCLYLITPTHNIDVRSYARLYTYRLESGGHRFKPCLGHTKKVRSYAFSATPFLYFANGLVFLSYLTTTFLPLCI